MENHSTNEKVGISSCEEGVAPKNRVRKLHATVPLIKICGGPHRGNAGLTTQEISELPS